MIEVIRIVRLERDVIVVEVIFCFGAVALGVDMCMN